MGPGGGATRPVRKPPLAEGARHPVEGRDELQASQESRRALAARYGLNPKTVAKWRKRTVTTETICLSRAKVFVSASMTRRASAVVESSIPGTTRCTITNSSPPIRATNSPSLQAARSRSPRSRPATPPRGSRRNARALAHHEPSCFETRATSSIVRRSGSRSVAENASKSEIYRTPRLPRDRDGLQRRPARHAPCGRGNATARRPATNRVFHAAQPRTRRQNENPRVGGSRPACPALSSGASSRRAEGATDPQGDGVVPLVRTTEPEPVRG